ncbi:zinc finger SWIM domain-containing protein 3 [Dioscorea alata]|uniref:Zinc finger SWIM domain-containing protein 3 n=1 Tax=Dioscorea alata TaxID=55571 RepID=A0ACB7W062_DIOAL|nr:zinc finger SWIM domain-containing protein 3 [Dioscorea alata]
MQESLEKASIMDVSSTENWVPKLDMVFETDEKAYQFYCFYGKEMGFGVRKHLVKRRSSGLVYSRVFSCYKEGYCRTTKEGKKPRSDVRTGCKARMTVRITKDGEFRVSEFEPNHNHELMAKVDGAISDSPEDITVVVKPGKKRTAGQVFGRSSIANNIRVKKFLQYDNVQLELDQKNGTESEENCWQMMNVASLVPNIGMEFEDDDEAYQFYINYAAGVGFSVRKHLIKRRVSGMVYSRVYVCHKEGFTRNRCGQARRPRPYDRTGCPASMIIKITKNGRYRVAEFEQKHNHPLVIPTKAHLFKWQWRRGLINTQDGMADSADDSVMTQEHGKGSSDGPATSWQPELPSGSHKKKKPLDQKNFMKVGDIGAMMQYFQEKQSDDPSFYYAIRVDQDEQISSIFWSDAKSMVDFCYFGDVVCFDTTFKVRDCSRPFALFVGVNHHKQAIAFGTTLIYDESVESFKWLFQTFTMAMCGKQPKVILTDHSAEMKDAVAAVWPGTTHRFCAWHMYQNASKHLNSVFQGSPSFAKDFSHCVYDCEEEDDFSSEWKNMLEKYDLVGNDLLTRLYEDRHQWALAYGRETFCADMTSTLTNESISGALNVSQGSDLLDFLKHYEGVLGERRLLEVKSDIQANQSVSKLPSSRMLKQTIHAYTPAVYKIFQREFELSMDCMVYSSGQDESSFEFKVTDEEKTKEYKVRFDSSDGTVFCSCKKFEFVGLHCRHVLKALDMINVKELQSRYILKRWSKNAKVGSLQNNHGFPMEGYTKSCMAKHYRHLCHMLDKIAVKAAESVESYTLIESLSDQLLAQVCQILKARPPDKPETLQVIYIQLINVLGI